MFLTDGERQIQAVSNLTGSVVDIANATQSGIVPVCNDAAFAADLLKWGDSNHECLLFSVENHVVHFLSLDPKRMRQQMYECLH
jgi:hypothetical protein